MNEKIKELLKEAQRYGDGIAQTDDEFDSLMLDKFAELIVKECINSIEQCYIHNESGCSYNEFESGYQKGIYKAKAKVMSHLNIQS